MRYLMRATGTRLARLTGACALLAGGIGGPVVLAAGNAQAAACGAAVPAGTPCTLTGTIGVAAGVLALTSPTALAWITTANGLDQQLADPAAAHQSYLVN